MLIHRGSALFTSCIIKSKHTRRISHTVTTMRGYIDAHAHLIHDQFAGEEDTIAVKCKDHGLDYVIVNGLEPVSNRAVVELCARHPNLVAACGIYPLDAACNVIAPDTWKHPFPQPARFDIEAEVAHIGELARTGKIVAVGECGLDKHYLTDDVSMAEQERVLRLLARVAKAADVPLILHSRKQEERLLEILLEEGVVKADIHCFMGKPKLGVRYAEAGYYLSIPSAVEKAGSSFRKLVEALPMDRILTETDSPYMGPDKGVRNDPTTVVRGVAAIADVKKISADDARTAIRHNFRTLFGI